MSKKPTITDTEWPIMEVLWEKGSATSAEIIEQVTERHDVTARTVKALLNRLLTKQAVGYERDTHDSRLYHYRATVSRIQLLKEKNKSLLGILYGNNPMKLLTRFVRDSKLSASEIAELRALLDDKEKGNWKKR